MFILEGDIKNDITDFVDIIFERLSSCSKSVAYACQNVSVTYMELIKKINETIDLFESYGIKEGDYVLVKVERCIELPTILLSLLKIGAVYIPIDNNIFPLKRIEFIKKDSNADFIIQITQDYENGNNVIVTRLKEAKDQREYIKSKIAYIIYTSGTTGNPKGVIISRSALSNFLLSMQVELNINKDDVVLSTTLMTFDIAFLELFLPIYVGGKCVIVPNKSRFDANIIEEVCQRNQVSFMQATPAYYNMLIKMGWRSTPDITLLCGGEAIDSLLASKLIKMGKKVWNIYGPTETTIWSSLSEIVDENNLCIGNPIMNTFFCVRDVKTGKFIKDGVGELVIGGMGVAEGYLNNKELSESKFSFIMLSEEDEIKKIYYTGDLVKITEQRTICYIDRIDNQVKINGYRIELKEIEKVLMDVGNFDAAVVEKIVYKAEAFLVGFVVGSNMKNIFKKLSNVLPQYMIPKEIVYVDVLPMSANGKCNRGELKKNYVMQLQQKKIKKEVNTINEIIVEEIKNVTNLYTEKINESSILSSIGISSIDYVSLASNLNMLNIRLTPIDIMKCYTIAEVIELAKQCREVYADDSKFLLNDETIRGKNYINLLKDVKKYDFDIEDVFPVEGLCKKMLLDNFIYRRRCNYNQCVCWKVHNRLDRERSQKTLRILGRQISSLRSVYAVRNALKPLRIVKRSMDIDIDEFEIGDESYINSIVYEELSKPFNLEKKTPFRMKIIQCRGKSILLWSYHHILFDGYSINFLIEEFISLYKRGADKGLTYLRYCKDDVDYVNWLSSRGNKKEIEFWKSQEFTKIGTEPCYINKSYEKSIITIDKCNMGNICYILRKLNITVAQYLTLIWGICLAYYKKEKAALFGMVFSGRNQCPGVFSNCVGMFINILPISITINPNSTFLGLLKNMSSYLKLCAENEHFDFFRYKWINNLNEVLIFDEKGMEERATTEYEKIIQDENIPRILSAHISIKEQIDLIFCGDKDVYNKESLDKLGCIFNKLYTISSTCPYIKMVELYNEVCGGDCAFLTN